MQKDNIIKEVLLNEKSREDLEDREEMVEDTIPY